MNFSQRLAHQLEVTLRSGSTWVVGLVGLLAAFYQQMSPEQQAAIVDAIPFLKGNGAIVTAFIIWLGVKLKPSTALSTQTAALVNEVARLRANVVLAAAGKPLLPPDPHTTTALPPQAAIVPDPSATPSGQAIVRPASIPAAPAPARQAGPLTPLDFPEQFARANRFEDTLPHTVAPTPPPPAPPASPDVDVTQPHVDTRPVDPRVLMALIQRYLATQPGMERRRP